MSATIVVGVSSRSGSPRALEWAVEEESYRQADVVAVRAWRPTPRAGSGSHPPLTTYDPTDAYDAEQARLDADVLAALGPDHLVHCRLVRGGRRTVLLAASAEALLLVLDAPRRTELRSGPLLAQRLSYAATCPVVVMPPAMTQAGPS